MRPENLNISISQMWYFIQVVEDASYSKAARSLNVTQSTVSKSIQTLEKNLNLTLFTRDNKRLVLTEAGILLYEKWKAILIEIEDTLDTARRYAGGNSRALHIGTLDSHWPELFLIDYVDKFYAKNPHNEVTIESTTPKILKNKLESNEFDLIFTVRYEAEYGNWADYNVHILETCPLVACMKPSNPLMAKSRISIEDLKQCNLIVISGFHVPTYNQMILELCKDNGFKPNMIYNATNANSQIFNLRHDNDIFICDRFHRDYTSDNLIFRPIKNTVSGVAMIWKKENDLPALKSFLSMFDIHQTEKNK